MIKTIIKYLIDFAFPARCLLCGEVMLGEDGICAACFNLIDFVDEPMCRLCGRPFEFEAEKGVRLICPKCLKRRPKFDRCASAVMYNDGSKKLVLPFKHCDKTHLAKFMAGVMSARLGGLVNEADAVIPVPIHITRMIARKYNQSALLARFVGKACGKPVFYNTLVRVRATKSQGRMSEKERRRNVRDAFRVKPRPGLAGATVVLIDDVFTTGATAEECAKALKEAGVKSVFVLTFARA